LKTFVVRYRICRYIYRAAFAGKRQCFVKQHLLPIDVGWVENARGQFAQRECLAHQIEAAIAVAQVQVNDPGFSGDHAGDVGITCDSQQLIARRLTRAMIAKRQLADANDRIQINDVVANTTSQRHRGYVIATSMAPGTEALFSERPGLRKQSPRISSRIVSTQYADNAGYTRARKGAQR